jgi:hypothetical protein
VELKILYSSNCVAFIVLWRLAAVCVEAGTSTTVLCKSQKRLRPEVVDWLSFKPVQGEFVFEHVHIGFKRVTAFSSQQKLLSGQHY